MIQKLLDKGNLENRGWNKTPRKAEKAIDCTDDLLANFRWSRLERGASG